jgi:amidophosphoribosyltransferase
MDEITRYITADSLGYLSKEGLVQAVGGSSGSYCRACFSGGYPVKFPMLKPEPQLDLFKKE